MSDKTFEMAMLFDFYGDLLTEKQREYFRLYYSEDLSLSEIAETEGITRQGVRDILRRAEKVLTETEAKTGLVRRFGENSLVIDKIALCAEEIKGASTDTKIKNLADTISENLELLRQ